LRPENALLKWPPTGEGDHPGMGLGMDLHIGRRLDVAEIRHLLEEARARTVGLLRSVSEADQRLQHDPLMSPILWDLGHIAHFEEVWLVENLGSSSNGSEGLRGMYNPVENPRNTRAELPLPGVEACFEYMSGVREAALERLAAVDLASEDRLLDQGFVFRMVLQHEYQHNETILQTLQLKSGEPYHPDESILHPVPHPVPPEDDAFVDGAMVRFPGGEVEIGTDDRSVSYDNERPRHSVELAPFLIDATPVTEAAYAAFMAEGGYDNRDLWSDQGWAWRNESGVRHPKNWREGDDGWEIRIMDRITPPDARRPVCHVCYYEAEAYATLVGKRLPTEWEWEAAATWDPATGTKRTYPWGEEPATQEFANVDVLTFGPAPSGSYVRNLSPIGCYGMIGDVWEWTSTNFHAYPGYETFPYPEYSEVFFGDDYRVLRGGSWATRGSAIRGTFRNWDYPIRRQIFSGFRCVRDA
jgi:iron(II)-dependent oxidoreductase